MAEDKIGPGGGRVVAGRRAYLPGHLGVGQRAAGIVAGFHRYRALVPGEVRAGGLVPRHHLELGATELLHLEAVVVGQAAQVSEAALGFQDDPRVAKVGVLRQGKDKVKATQGIGLGPALL